MKVLFKGHYHEEGPPNDPASAWQADRRDFAILCLVVAVFCAAMVFAMGANL